MGAVRITINGPQSGLFLAHCNSFDHVNRVYRVDGDKELIPLMSAIIGLSRENALTFLKGNLDKCDIDMSYRVYKYRKCIRPEYSIGIESGLRMYVTKKWYRYLRQQYRYYRKHILGGTVESLTTHQVEHLINLFFIDENEVRDVVPSKLFLWFEQHCQ